MSKLIFANFGRLKKDMTLWLCMAFMFAAGVFVSLKTTTELPLDRVFFAYALIIGLVSSVFCGLFIGTEHGDGTMRNKIIVGHTKASVYLANLIACIVSGFAFCFSFIVPMLAIGVPRLGFFEMGITNVLMLLSITLALSTAFSCIFTLISMLCRNKAVVAVACILCFILLLCLGASINSRLQEPEKLDSYVTNVTGVGEMQNEPNPDYLSGTKRQAYQFLLDINPGGQAIQFAELSMVHSWQLLLYSLLVSILTTVTGVVIFRKKNLN